jgi:hypothetical protein
LGPVRTTEFLNLDVVVTARRSLEPLLDGLGRDVVVLRARREGRVHEATLELADFEQARTLEGAIRGFVRLVEALPAGARHAWDRARSRRFDVGIEAGAAPTIVRLGVSARMLRGVAAIGGDLAVTVYPRRTGSISSK